jgi:hypothetical protein
MLVSCTLNLHHSTDPACRDSEAAGCLVDEFGEPMDSERVAACAPALGTKTVETAIWHTNGAMARMTRAIARRERSHASSAAAHGSGFSVAGRPTVF